MLPQRSYQASIANHSLVVHHQSYQAPAIHQQPQALFPQLDSGLVVLLFLPFDDLIASLNKAIAFISTKFASRYPPTNNQLRTSSILKNQAAIQDGRVTVQMVQGRQTQGYASIGACSNATGIRVNRNGGTNTTCQEKVIRWNNGQEEGHSERQCTKLKKPMNLTWLKEKMLLIEALQSGEIPIPAIFQTNDLDAFDSNCDEAPLASVVFMAKLYAYNSDVLSEVPRPDTYQNDNVIDQSVQEMKYSEQPSFINDSVINITNGSNVISYDQYLQETKNEVVQDTNCSTQQDKMIMSVIKEMSNQVAKCNENPLYLTYAQRKVHTLYCGHKIVKKHDALYVMDNEETLTLAEESRLKMYDKQNDQIAKDRKVNIALIDYAALNNLSKHFVPQKQLFAKQAFWLPISKPVSKSPPVQSEPVLKEIPHELPTISLAKEITDMKEFMNQMETEVAKCSVKRKCFEIQKKTLILKNDQLLELIYLKILCILL
nr:hypothetical protein [Tanacetum cinerariifolium]